MLGLWATFMGPVHKLNALVGLQTTNDGPSPPPMSSIITPLTKIVKQNLLLYLRSLIEVVLPIKHAIKKQIRLCKSF